MTRTTILLSCLVVLAACGDDGGAADSGTDTGRPPTDTGTTDSGTDAGDTGVSDTSVADAGGDTSAPPDTGPPADCDFRAVDGIVVMEGESLPLTESWEVRSAEAGYTGAGYIEWTGASHNNDPTHGVMEVAVCLESAGRYRIQWHTRIGIGADTTEHNDTWVQFGGVTDYFGARGPSDGETRRYPHPACDDDTFMTSIRGLPTVTEAECVRGSSRDGWLKVYCSGAADWRWSTNTSDSDGHDVVFEVDGPGSYTLMLAARADGHLIDRIVIHDASLPDMMVRDLALAETR